MDLTGQYIAIWVQRAELNAIFAFDDTDGPDATYMFGGKVIGEAAHIGLWVDVEVVYFGDEPKNVLPAFEQKRPRRLVRWEYMRAVEIWPDKPKEMRPIGFKLPPTAPK